MSQTKKRSAPKHFTRERQQYARSKVSSESCSINGAKGARVTIERYGADALFKRWQAWKLANPSRPERVMIDLLTRLEIRFEREKRIGDSLYSMDFYLTETHQSIEVNSQIHTRLNAEKRKRQAATLFGSIRLVSKVTISRRRIHKFLDLAAGIVPARPAIFSAGVNARKLKEIAGLLPSEEFDIYADRSAVRIECGRLYYRMLAMPPKDFPETFKEPDRSIALPPDFRDLIQSALFSAGSEGSNYALHGAKLEIRKDGRLRLIATNGHALSFVETNCDTGHELDCVLPKQTLSVLAKLLEDESCTMLYGETRVQFKAGDKILSSRTIAGIFPDYERVLPSHSLCATVGRGGFAEAIRRTGLCADGPSNAVCATFRAGEIELRAASEETGEAEEIVPADLSLGQTMEAGFNAKYLRDFLAVAPEGDIRIYFKDGRTQFEMRSAESRWTHRYVIMPMML